MVKSNNNNSNSPVITEVNGHCGDLSICEMWADVYRDLFKDDNAEGADTTVSSTTHEPSKSIFRVSLEKVSRCVQKLKRGKACGPDGLSAESIQFASPVVGRLLANIFNACLAHSFIPASLMTVTIVPILKKGLNTSKSSNYRPIALAQVISKVFELIILDEYEENLSTQPTQFGYKKKSGTELAVFTLRQIAHSYMRRGSTVYLCYLDASKAFDTVDHQLLLSKLNKRGIDGETISLLKFWFDSQRFSCKWNNTTSNSFPVRKGVRQGGIASAYFFAVYMDDLCTTLTNTGIGCKVGMLTCNHLLRR